MVYLILVILFMIPIFKKWDLDIKDHNRYYWFLCISLILVAGFRNQVGGDSFTYMSDWQYYPQIQDLNLIMMVVKNYMPLWVILNSAIKTVVDDFVALQLIVSLVVNIATFHVVKNESRQKFAVVFVYALLQYLYFNCEVLREAIAVSIFYIAFYCLVKKDYIKYYILITISFLFHDSSIIYFVLPLVMKYIRKEFTPRTIVWLGVISLILLNPVVLEQATRLLPGLRSDGFVEGYTTMRIGSMLGFIRSMLNVIFFYLLLTKTKDKLSITTLYGLKLFFILHIVGIAVPVLMTRISNYVNIFYYIAVIELLYSYRKYMLSYVFSFMLVFTFVNYYFMDVTHWVEADHGQKSRYYFYELFYPYYSVFEEPSQEVITRRLQIYYQEETHANK